MNVYVVDFYIEEQNLHLREVVVADTIFRAPEWVYQEYGLGLIIERVEKIDTSYQHLVFKNL